MLLPVCPRATSRVAGFVVAGLLVAVATPRADVAAQGLATSINAYCIDTEPGFQQVANGSIQRTCTTTNPNLPWVGTASTYASAVDGILRASSSFDPSSIPDGRFNGGTGVSSVALWQDKFRVGADAGTPAFARFLFTWNGRLETYGAGTADANFQFGAGNVYGSKSHLIGFLGTESLDVAESFEILTPLGQYSDGWGVDLGMQISAGVVGAGNNTDIGARSLFGNSAGISGVELLDANQQVIGNVSYTFLNGLQLYATTTVPEPQTFALVVFGLVGIVAARRRVLKAS